MILTWEQENYDGNKIITISQSFTTMEGLNAHINMMQESASNLGRHFEVVDIVEDLRIKFKVYEWDFVLHKGDLKLTTNSFEESKAEALKIASGFCEDEEPDFYKVGKVNNEEIDSWNAFTGCDFGAKIILEFE